MEYQVPQFIEVEDKIIGPLTLKQFIYIAGAAGLCIIFFFYLPLVAALLLAAPVVALAAALAFYRVNGKSFIEILEAGFNYYTGAKLFLWRHEVSASKPKPPTHNNESAVGGRVLEVGGRNSPRLTRGKLQELAWSLDIRASDPSLGLRSEQK
jgi:hypothetical protein